MSLNASLQISASGLTAERLRLDLISNNLANVNTTRTPAGGPYRRQIAVFAERGSDASFASQLQSLRCGDNSELPGAGVEVASIEPDMSRDFKIVVQPGHPDADAQDRVRLPNVEPILEMVDMISASRAYEAGVTAINTAKQMQMKAMEIGRA